MRRLFAMVAACGVAVSLAVASEATAPTPAPPPATIQALVEQLGSERHSDREAASAALEKIGPAALPALQQAATRSENPEVRERASILVVKLKRAADSSARLTAKRVKLEYKDIPLGTAVNDLKARTGLNIALDPNKIANPLRKVTCQTGEVPVWEALEAFCVAAELREVFVNEFELPKQPQRRGYTPPPPPPNADAVPVVLIDGRPDRMPGDRSTLVRVAALPPGFAGHKVTIGTGELTLCLDVTPAPGLHWQDVVGVKVTRVIDSSGRAGGGGVEKPLPTPYDPNGNFIFVRPGVVMRFDPNTGNPIPPATQPNPRVVPVPLKVATPSARSLKRLEGVVYGEMIAPNQQLITVADLKKNNGGSFNGPGELKLTILELKEAAGPGAVGTLRLQLEYPSPWARNLRGGWNFGWPEPPQHPSQGKTVQAFDAAGKPFPLKATSNYTDIGGDGLTHIQMLEYRFGHGIGVPAKLVVVGPKTVLVEVPFAMENVPLP